MTRVYIEPSGRRIQPFDDPVGEALIQNRPLADWQTEMLRDAGLEKIAALEPPCLVIPDTLLSTGAVLRRFVDRAAGRDALLVLGDSLFGRRTTPVQPHVEPLEGGWRFEKIRFVSGRNEDPVDITIDPDETVRQIELPVRYTDHDDLEIAMPRHPVMTLHHWAHILWANQIMGLVQWRTTPAWRIGLAAAWAGLRALSWNKWKILRKANRIGRGCDIHPTAVVEVSRLGDGVRVGPFARVLASTVGDGALIMAGAHVEGSTVGERVLVTQSSYLRMCVLYPESISGFALMQQCILGRRAVTTLGSGAIDLNFERPIRVPLDGELHSTGAHFLGSAFGHDSRIGTGVYFASGREVPNGYFVVKDPNQIVQRIPEGLAGRVLATNDGTLRPLD